MFFVQIVSRAALQKKKTVRRREKNLLKTIGGDLSERRGRRRNFLEDTQSGLGPGVNVPLREKGFCALLETFCALRGDQVKGEGGTSA